MNKININSLILGDQALLFKDIPDDSIDAIVTDPPYGVLGNHKIEVPFDEELFFAECKRVLKPDGRLIFACHFDSMLRWHAIASKHFKNKNFSVWDKKQPSNMAIMPNSRIEIIMIYSDSGYKTLNKIKVLEEKKGTDHTKKYDKLLRKLSEDPLNNSESVSREYLFGRATLLSNIKNKETYFEGEFKTKNHVTIGHGRLCTPSTLLEYEVFSYMSHNKNYPGNDKYRVDHPTVKPINLMQHLIGLVAKPGDTILDPFCGSGSTLIAAKVLDVNYIGFELHEQYYDIAKERLKTAKQDYKKNILYEHEYKEQIDKMIKEFKEKQNVKVNQLDIFS